MSAGRAVRSNPVKAAISSGQRVVNAWCSIGNPYVAEITASIGFDSVTIDLQHGAIDYQTAFSMLQAISTTPAAPFVRVPWNDPAILMKCLDAGAYGVICPMINSARDAEAFVSACRYPPRGTRSVGPNRAVQYAGTDYIQNADNEILLFAMIETETAVRNLDEILAVDGFDGIYVGPGDLSLSIGAKPSMMPTEERVVAAIETILTKTRERGLIAAIHTDGPQTALRRYAQGFQLCTLQSDVRHLINGMTAALSTVRSAGNG